MVDGWFRLYRKIQDSALWKDKPFSKGQAWIDLLISTAYHDHSFWVRGVEVKVGKGQIALSELSMAKRWGWSRDKVRRFLSYLEDESKIRQQKSNVTTLITVVNWDKHQDHNTPNKHQTNTKQTPNDTQSKKVKKEKNNTEVPDWLDEDLFEDFLAMRKQIKKPMTDRAITRLLKKLEGFRSKGHCPNNALEASIFNCWSDVYEPKEKKDQSPTLRKLN